MAKIILDVPTEKMQSFIKAILNLGIDRHSITSKNGKAPEVTECKFSFKRLSRKYLFGWEFFSNELEFE